MVVLIRGLLRTLAVPRSVSRDQSRQHKVANRVINPSQPPSTIGARKLLVLQATPCLPGKGDAASTREGGLLDRHRSLLGVHRRAELQQRLLEAPRGELRHGALRGQLVGVLIRHLLEVVQISGQIM